MPIPQPYYLDAPSLGSATTVFSDNALTVCAPDGFYSSGGITRRQIGCVLFPQQECPSCSYPCAVPIAPSDDLGVYSTNIVTSPIDGYLGAIIIRFNPLSYPDGIRATLNSSVYNKITSPVDGLHQSTNSIGFTYIGDTAFDCGISGTTYPTLINYLYNGVSFINLGTTQSITVAAGDVSLSAVAPGNCMLVVPKTSAVSDIINIEIATVCVGGTDWDLIVGCAEPLVGYSSTVVGETKVIACLLSPTETYYNASLNATPGIVGLFDFVYSDAYGQFPLADGFYKIPDGGGDISIEVLDGVVIVYTLC